MNNNDTLELEEATQNSIAYSRSIARQLKLRKNNLRELLAGTRLTVDRFVSDDVPLTNIEQFNIFRNVLKITNDSSYGLELGKKLTPTAHGAMGFLVYSSPSLLSALKDFSKYLPIRVGFARLVLNEKADTMECMIDVFYTEDPDVYRMISEAFAVSLLCLIENILGEEFTDAELYCRYKKPDYYYKYQDYIHCPVHFNCNENKLVIPLSYMNEINISSDFSTYEYSLIHCQRLLKETCKTDDSTKMRVRKLLLSNPSKLMTEQEVAESMFICKRTLSRRLESEGTGFRDIRNEVLTSLTKSYLTETNLSIDTIARMLNYHDASSFRRAFKRMHNITPHEFRKQANKA